MPLTSIPEKTEDSLGIVKQDVLPYLDPDTQVPAVQYERLKDAVIASATAVGLGDGSTPGSLVERLDNHGLQAAYDAGNTIDAANGPVEIDALELGGASIHSSDEMTISSKKSIQIVSDDTDSEIRFGIDGTRLILCYDAGNSSYHLVPATDQGTHLGDAQRRFGVIRSKESFTDYAEATYSVISPALVLGSGDSITRPGASQIDVATGGATRVTVGSTSVTSTLPLRLPTGGGPSAPVYSFSGDTDTGIYRSAANAVGVATGGALRLEVTSSLVRTTLPIEMAPVAPGAPAGTDRRIGVWSTTGRPPLLAEVDASFGERLLGASLGDRSHCFILPSGTATPDTLGLDYGSSGTITKPALASTNFRTSSKRINVATAAAAGSSADVRAKTTHAWRGNAAGRGGFVLHVRWAPNPTLTASQRALIGLTSSVATLGNANPSSLLNIIGLGYDSTDSNVFVMHNDGSGAATKVDTGISCRTSAVVLDCTLIAPPNGGTIAWHVHRVDGTAGSATGSITTDLPSTTTFLAVQAWVNNTQTAASAAIDVMRVVLEELQ